MLSKRAAPTGISLAMSAIESMRSGTSRVIRARAAIHVREALGLHHAENAVPLSDGYAAYQSYAKKLGLPHAQCWSHSRGTFFDAQAIEADGVRAALGQLQVLYEIEAVDELKVIQAAGIITIVDLTPYDGARDVRQLEEVSRKSGPKRRTNALCPWRAFRVIAECWLPRQAGLERRSSFCSQLLPRHVLQSK